ncbi:hypothetical protein MMC07_001642 [Pseudocyphellaria aurata]|nr:hypothetical protein [Pseudocyphellaria aurata]
MLTSLPPLAPLGAHALFHPSLNPQLSTSSSSHNNHPNNQIRQNQPGPQQQSQFQSQQPTRTLLSTLRADEHAILVRKANIARFGATWLRPAGVAKTLQGLADEQAEREEAEAGAAREYTLPEAQPMLETEHPSADDRDLDDEVPDADEGEGGWIDEEDDEEDDLDVQENLQNLHNGYGAPMVADRDNIGMDAEGDIQYAFGDRDLDDDIPEGMDGSYQHTDTEVEDESSEGEIESEAQTSVLDHSVWGSVTGGTISGVGGNLPLPGGVRGQGRRRSGGRMPGREN